MKRSDDLILGFSFFWILALLVMPLPAGLLDVMLALSLTLGLLVLLVALFTEKPLDFSVFPALLLILTLFRLGLNVASTRLILTRGNEGSGAAGNVIQAFGDIVVGGNYLVGVILFAIFVTINFIVIAKGSGRIAEVAARFTLDAMPGKQMAIDADLNQGVIDDAEARTRRREIQREADFHGAMDGASKFVKGDAIAGLVIMAINILGGLAVGVLQGGLPLGEAVETYTLLTVGDGLVGQIPALVVSTAAGIVVARTAEEEPLSGELRSQMIFQPRALYGVSAMLCALALTPGLPFFPFALMAGASGGLGAWVSGREDEAKAPEPEPAAEPPNPEEEVREALVLDELELEVGYGLLPLVVEDQGGELLGRIRATRKKLAQDLGFVIPLVHVRDNLELEPSAYRVLLRGNALATSRVPPGRLLALRPSPDAPEVPGIETRDAAFDMPAVWIQPRDRDLAESHGYAVVDGATAIATHLAELIREHAPELLTRHQVKELLDSFGERAPKVVEEIVPNIVSVSLLHRTLRALLEEGVSVRDLGSILETLAEYAPRLEDPDLLTDLVRERLSRTIVRDLIDEAGSLRVLTLEPAVEEQLKNGVQRTQSGAFLSVDPKTLDRLLNGVEQKLRGPELEPGGRPVLLISQNLRAPLRQVLSRIRPRLSVLSHNELPPEVKVVAVGQLGLAGAH